MSKLTGLILTGGRSSRMGQDKSKLIYHHKPQREHLVDLLSPYCERVYWSVNEEQKAELTGADQPFIVDAFSVATPLNGILSAFQHDPESAWLVVACDMPLITNQSLDALLEGRNTAKLATVFYDSDGLEPEPLLGIYEPAFWPILKQALLEGYYSPRKLLQLNDIQILVAPAIRELANVNDPQTRAQLGL